MLLSFAKRVLEIPVIFESYQAMVGAPSCHDRFIRDYVAARSSETVLDVGCGTGVSLNSLPRPIGYTGIDISDAYIRRAQAQHGNDGVFLAADATGAVPEVAGPFDRIFAFGVLHHLSPEQVHGLIANLTRWLKPGGSFTSIDPCFIEGQNAIARYIVQQDRGQFVRTPEALFVLFKDAFAGDVEVVTDMLRIPYTQVILRLTRC